MMIVKSIQRISYSGYYMVEKCFEDNIFGSLITFTRIFVMSNRVHLFYSGLINGLSDKHITLQISVSVTEQNFDVMTLMMITISVIYIFNDISFIFIIHSSNKIMIFFIILLLTYPTNIM